MISVEFAPATAQINAYNAALSEYPTQLSRAYRRNTSRLRTRWLAALRVEPPPAGNFYPLRWRSAKERRFVIAELRREGNLPYQRTHELIRGWRVVIEDFDRGSGALSAYNTSYKAISVYGDYDTPRHPMFGDGGIPWLDPAEVHFQYASEAEAVLAGTILTFSPFAGVPQP